MSPLAQWLHDRRIDCKWEYVDALDIGMGKRYTDDHEPAHERAATELLKLLSVRVGAVSVQPPQMVVADGTRGMERGR